MSSINNNIRYSETSSSSPSQFFSNVRKRAPQNTKEEEAQSTRKRRQLTRKGAFTPGATAVDPQTTTQKGLTKEKVMSLFNHGGQKRFTSFSMGLKNETMFSRVIQAQRPKVMDTTITTQPLYNNNTYSEPICLTLVPPGMEIFQRVGNVIQLVSLRFTLQVDYPSLYVPFKQQDKSMPDSVLTYAIVHVRGFQDKTFSFNDIFRDYDYQGNPVEADSLYPPFTSLPNNATNAFAFPRAGNSHQGYDDRFKVLYHGQASLSGVASILANGSYSSDFTESSDSRFQFTGNVFDDKAIDLLNADLLSRVNYGDPLTTTFRSGVAFSGSSQDITDGAVYLVYGVSYPASLFTTPLMTFKSRLQFLQPMN